MGPNRVILLGLLAIFVAACGGIGQSGVGGAGSSNIATAISQNVPLGECGKQTRHIVTPVGDTAITGTPSRIVSIEISFTDDLVRLGVKPVGLGDDNDRDTLVPEIRSKVGNYTSIGTRESPNLAVISSLRPDLIIADQLGNKAILPQLKNIAPTMALLSQHATYQQNLDTAGIIGVAINKCDTMKKLLSDHDALMKQLVAKGKKGDKRSFIYATTTGKSVTVYAADNYYPQVVQLFGLPYAFPNPPGNASQAQVTLETLTQLNPDIVFWAREGDTGSNTLFDQWLTSSVWQSTTAQKDHQVYLVSQHRWSLTRGIDGSEFIARDVLKDLYGKT
jgi:ferric citrate transport system substrate-binding protein